MTCDANLSESVDLRLENQHRTEVLGTPWLLAVGEFNRILQHRLRVPNKTAVDSQASGSCFQCALSVSRLDFVFVRASRNRYPISDNIVRIGELANTVPYCTNENCAILGQIFV